MDLRSHRIPNIDRHEIRPSADIILILDYLEKDFIPSMLDGFAEKPHLMLGGSLRQLLNTINCSIVLKCPDTEIQRYLDLFHTVALCHFRIGSGGDPFAAKIDGKIFHFSPEAHSSYMKFGYMELDLWTHAVHVCAIVDDMEGIRWLCQLTEDMFTYHDKISAPFDLAYYRYWVGFISGGDKAEELLNFAIETATHTGQETTLRTTLRQQFVNTIRQPELRLLQAILDGDAVNFNRQLLATLEAHKQFWSQSTHAFIPKGWISLPLLAVCAIARNHHNFSIEVESDYLPKLPVKIK